MKKEYFFHVFFDRKELFRETCQKVFYTQAEAEQWLIETTEEACEAKYDHGRNYNQEYLDSYVHTLHYQLEEKGYNLKLSNPEVIDLSHIIDQAKEEWEENNKAAVRNLAEADRADYMRG